MSKFATQRQLSLLILETRKSSFLSDQRHLTTWSTSLQMTPVGFILWKQVNLIEDNVSGQWEIRFSWCFAVQGKSGVLEFVQFCKKIALNADFLNFLKRLMRQL